jgi:hypothetical protein
MTSWTIDIPEVPPSRNSEEAKGWKYVQLKARWKRDVALLCKEQQIPKCARIKTEPRIYFPDNGHRDYDNYGIVNKLVHDGIVAAGVIPADDPRYVAKPSYPDLLLDRKHPRTEVDIIVLEGLAA